MNMDHPTLSARSLAAALGGDLVSPDSVLAPGPGHSSKDRSLSVQLDPSAPDGFTVFSHAGDDWKACRDYVRQKLGLEPWAPKGRDASRRKSTASDPVRRSVAQYVYHLRDGTPYLRVDRYEGPKSFPQYHWTSSGWAKGKPRGPKIPYRLPEILASPQEPVFVVEGEKDADALHALGLTATTASEGAGKWTPELDEWFAGRTVFILPDNDEPGRAHARKVAEHLHGVAVDVRVVALPDLPEKGDVSDWLAAGGNPAGLLVLCKASPSWAPDGSEASPAPRDRSDDQGGTASSPARPETGPSWLDGCILDSYGRPIPNHANVMAALRRDPALSHAVAFDQMAALLMLMQPLPRSDQTGYTDEAHYPRPVTDQDVGVMQEYLQHAGLRRVARETVHQAVDQRARERSFHPVRDYLSNIKWDGRKRLDEWLTTYLGADASDYTAAVGAMFLIAMVARVFDPGCKVDTLLVLEGPQGARKSTACAILGGPWFSDALPDITQGKEVAVHLAGKWLIEVGEMHAMSRAETTHLKAFITRTTERYRPPYGRMEVVQPRQCVFVATTNEAVYLRDTTGGRRFWPVKVGVIDTDALARDRDQLFAEAVAAYQTGRPWWPDAAFEREHVVPQQEARFEADPWEQPIIAFFNGRSKATVGEIATGALGFETRKIGTADQRRVTAILEGIGMIRLAKDSAGNRYWSRP